jgi:hypothetical protein
VVHVQVAEEHIDPGGAGADARQSVDAGTGIEYHHGAVGHLQLYA